MYIRYIPPPSSVPEALPQKGTPSIEIQKSQAASVIELRNQLLLLSTENVELVIIFARYNANFDLFFASHFALSSLSFPVYFNLFFHSSQHFI